MLIHRCQRGKRRGSSIYPPPSLYGSGNLSHWQHPTTWCPLGTCPSFVGFSNHPKPQESITMGRLVRLRGQWGGQVWGDVRGGGLHSQDAGRWWCMKNAEAPSCCSNSVLDCASRCAGATFGLCVSFFHPFSSTLLLLSHCPLRVIPCPVCVCVCVCGPTRLG